MRIGLVADTHDNLERTREAASILKTNGAEVVLHAGDLTTGAMVPFFEAWRTWLAQGNIDKADAIAATIEERKAPITYGEAHDVTLDGLRFGLLHGDDDGRLQGMIDAGAFHLVVHGHTHRFRDEDVGVTRVVNPGACHRTPEPSVCVYDTETRQLERYFLQG